MSAVCFPANKELNKEYYERNKEMNEECEEESYRDIRTTWPIECAGCLYRDSEYVHEIGENVECIHPIFSHKSYECPVRMTARAKKKFGRTALDDYI